MGGQSAVAFTWASLLGLMLIYLLYSAWEVAADPAFSLLVYSYQDNQGKYVDRLSDASAFKHNKLVSRPNEPSSKRYIPKVSSTAHDIIDMCTTRYIAPHFPLCLNPKSTYSQVLSTRYFSRRRFSLLQVHQPRLQSPSPCPIPPSPLS